MYSQYQGFAFVRGLGFLSFSVPSVVSVQRREQRTNGVQTKKAPLYVLPPQAYHVLHRGTGARAEQAVAFCSRGRQAIFPSSQVLILQAVVTFSAFPLEYPLIIAYHGVYYRCKLRLGPGAPAIC